MSIVWNSMVISALAQGGTVTVGSIWRENCSTSELGKNYCTDPRAQSSGVLYESISSRAVKEKGKRVAETGKWNEHISDSYIGLLAHNKNHIRYTTMLLYVIHKKL
jgi:hypothetical protein